MQTRNEEVAQQTETAALSMQVNPQAPPSSDVPVHLMVPLLSAPFQKLAHHQPRVASARLSRTQSDSEGVQER